jgi:hypothetical protein
LPLRTERMVVPCQGDTLFSDMTCHMVYPTAAVKP